MSNKKIMSRAVQIDSIPCSHTYSVKKMAFQDNDQGAGLLVDLDLNASKSLEVDLEAAGPSAEPPMVVAQRLHFHENVCALLEIEIDPQMIQRLDNEMVSTYLLRRQNDRSQEVDLVEVLVQH